MSVYDHPGTLELAAARDPQAADEAVRQHLEACLACRVRAARLWHELLPGDPSEDAVARILEASSPGPAIIATFTNERDPGPPRPGEIWRIGRDEALLVWVRQVFDDAIDVIPVVLDIELADQESVFLPAESTPLGMPLALLAGIRGHVGPRAMLQRIGYVHAFSAVREVMAAARDGRPPAGVAVGPPIETDDDQRIEYRQVVADLLADLAPDTWTGDGPPGAKIDQVMDLLRQELSFWQAGVQVLPMPLHQEPVSAGLALFPCARVTYLDTSIVVALISGAGLDESLAAERALPLACLSLARLEPDAAAIAIAGDAAGWPAVVLRVADLRNAYETPTGRLAAPRVARQSLPVGDALRKFLEAQATAWEVTEPVTARIGEIDIGGLASRSAATAVGDIAAQGRKSRMPAKKSAWARLPKDLGRRIAGSITAISAGEPVDGVLDALIGPDAAGQEEQ
jgi:hypothetical protein